MKIFKNICKGERKRYINFVLEALVSNYCGRDRPKEIENALEAILNLNNVIIDFWPAENLAEAFEDRNLRGAFLFSILHVLWPVANSILLNFLLGNLPVCFMQLRFMLETATKSLLADYHYGFEVTALHSIEKFEDYLKNKKLSMAKFFDEELGKIMGEDFSYKTKSLWGKLSEDWVHFRGLAKTIRSRFENGRRQPSYLYVVPVKLEKEDVDDLETLAKRVAETREILNSLFLKWQELLEKEY